MAKSPRPLTDADHAVIAAVFGADQPPGTIVRDFDVLLEHFPADGIPVTPKTHEFAIARLPELNSRLTHPAPIGLKRGRQFSYPHVDGLQLLLRYTRLGKLDRFGAKPRMLLNTEMIGKWQTLKPVDRYFSLLERWWNFSDSDQESRRRSAASLAEDRYDLLQRKAAHLTTGSQQWPEYLLQHLGWKDIALMQMFGLVDVVSQPAAAGQGWKIERIIATPWGRLATATYHQTFGFSTTAVLERLLDPAGVKSEEDELASEEESDRPPFFCWADTLYPLVPAWQRSLQQPDVGEPFRGSLTFKVSLGEGVWRRIVMPSDSTFADLAEFILSAFEFDYDHLYEFRYEDAYGSRHTLTDPQCSEVDDGYADEASLGETGLEPGQLVEFHFDFGADWRFAVLLEKLDETGAEVAPACIAQEGKAPRQYPYDDD